MVYSYLHNSIRRPALDCHEHIKYLPYSGSLRRLAASTQHPIQHRRQISAILGREASWPFRSLHYRSLSCSSPTQPLTQLLDQGRNSTVAAQAVSGAALQSLKLTCIHLYFQIFNETSLREGPRHQRRAVSFGDHWEMRHKLPTLPLSTRQTCNVLCVRTMIPKSCFKWFPDLTEVFIVPWRVCLSQFGPRMLTCPMYIGYVGLVAIYTGHVQRLRG